MRCAGLVGRVNGEEIVPSIDLVAWARARGLATDTSVQRGGFTVGGRHIRTGPQGCLRVGFSEPVLDRLGDRGRLGELDALGDVAFKNVMYPIGLYSVRPRSSHGLVPQRPGPRESSGVT